MHNLLRTQTADGISDALSELSPVQDFGWKVHHPTISRFSSGAARAFRTMSTRYFHRSAQFDAARGIPIQQPDRRPPHWRDAVHGGVLQYETIVPAVFGTMCSTWNATNGIASWGRRQYSHSLPALARTRARVRWSNYAARRERTRWALACIMETMSMASTTSWYSASSAGVSVPSFALPRNSSILASRSGSARKFRRADADSGVNAPVKGSSKRSHQVFSRNAVRGDAGHMDFIHQAPGLGLRWKRR